MQISAIYGILKYSEPLHNCFQVHIQNPVIFTKIGKLSILRFKNHFLTYSALQTLVPPNLDLLLHLSQILNIFNVSFSISLNRLNTLTPYQKFVQIGNAQNLGSGFI